MAIVERWWALWFGLAGRMARPNVRRWSSPGGRRVLALAPHPDDEAIGCGGTLIQHKRAGDQVWIAYATDGRRSRAMGLAPDEMARRRRQEAMASAAALGADRMEWIGLPEGEWAVEQLVAALRALLDQLAPDIVYAPSRVDFHPEHYRVAHALALLLADAAEPPAVRVYQVQVPLTAVLTNLVTDLREVAAECQALIMAYTTQKGSLMRTFR